MPKDISCPLHKNVYVFVLLSSILDFLLSAFARPLKMTPSIDDIARFSDSL